MAMSQTVRAALMAHQAGTRQIAPTMLQTKLNIRNQKSEIRKNWLSLSVIGSTKRNFSSIIKGIVADPPEKDHGKLSDD